MREHRRLFLGKRYNRVYLNKIAKPKIDNMETGFKALKEAMRVWLAYSLAITQLECQLCETSRSGQ